MKKFLIFKILYLFLGLVVMAGASVFATNTFLASQVSYGSTTVENALNDLFTQSNNRNYSTDEQIVGKWIDGKPMYRKIIIVNSINLGEWTYITDEFSNIDYKNIAHINLINSDGSCIPVSVSTNSTCWIYCTNNKLRYYITSSNNQGITSTSKLYITFEYTKTTDNPINK